MSQPLANVTSLSPQSLLHDDVERMLQATPRDATSRNALRAQAQKLQAQGDALGDHALGYLAVREAEAAPRLADSATLLAKAIPLLKKAAAASEPNAAFYLIQAYLNWHNIELQAGHPRKAETVDRELMDALAQLHGEVPAEELGHLGKEIAKTLESRDKQGHPHPQAAYMRKVAEKLQALSTDRPPLHGNE